MQQPWGRCSTTSASHYSTTALAIEIQSSGPTPDAMLPCAGLAIFLAMLVCIFYVSCSFACLIDFGTECFTLTIRQITMQAVLTVVGLKAHVLVTLRDFRVLGSKERRRGPRRSDKE